MSKRKKNKKKTEDEFSIFFCKLYFGLSCFLSVKTLGDANGERAYSSAAYALVLDRNGALNVFLCCSYFFPPVVKVLVPADQWDEALVVCSNI